MEWWHLLLLTLGTLLVIMLSGMPVAFVFFIVNFVILFIAVGQDAMSLLGTGIFSMTTSSALLAVPFFILMGETLSSSGLMNLLLDTIDAWLGRVPARLSVSAILAGTALSLMSGSSMATTAVMGSTLIPEMRRRQYSPLLSIGPILGSGGLAVIIPPSLLAVLVATLGQLSVAKVLMAGVFPGLVMALVFVVFVIVTAKVKPHLAPPYALERASFGDRLMITAKAMPLVVIVLLTLGSILVGIATPTEAAALGAAGSIVLAIIYRNVNSRIANEVLLRTAQTTVMIFFIACSAVTFGYVLGITGVSRGLATAITGLTLPTYAIILGMLLTVLVMGTFMDSIPIQMITVPIYIPIAIKLGYDPILLALLLMITVEMGTITPPYGILLFVMKGVFPEASMGEIINAGIPFVLLQLIVIAIVMAFPMIALWLPNLTV